MDFKVASSIYRKFWLMEPGAALSYADLLEQMRAGTARFDRPSHHSFRSFFDDDDEPQKGNPEIFQVRAEVIKAPESQYQASFHPGYQGKTVAILPLYGALMKEDFCGWFGTASLRRELQKMEESESLHTIILHVDSPGGTVDGTQSLMEALKGSKKRTIALVDGYCCSAAYWIASGCDEILATAQTDIIGSIGTMISFVDRTQYMEEHGIVLREFYATESKDKNKMFSEAMKGKGQLLIKQLLDPLNDVFLSSVRENRGKGLNEEETLTGKTFLSAQAQEYGLIDGLQSYDQTISQLTQKAKKNTNMKFNLKTTFAGIMAFLGVKAVEGQDTVELTDEQLGQIEAALPQLQEKTTLVEQLQQERDTLQASVQALTKERDNLVAQNSQLAKDVEALGKLDAGKITTAKSDGDKNTDTSEDPATMSFQRELMEKL